MNNLCVYTFILLGSVAAIDKKSERPLKEWRVFDFIYKNFLLHKVFKKVIFSVLLLRINNLVVVFFATCVFFTIG